MIRMRLPPLFFSMPQPYHLSLVSSIPSKNPSMIPVIDHEPDYSAAAADVFMGDKIGFLQN
jgi:hypothetical protein